MQPVYNRTGLVLIIHSKEEEKNTSSEYLALVYSIYFSFCIFFSYSVTMLVIESISESKYEPWSVNQKPVW